MRQNDFFAYTRVVVERPLHLRYRAGEDAVESLRYQPAFVKLAAPKKNSKDPAKERAAGEELQGQIIDFIRSLNGLETEQRAVLDAALAPLWKKVSLTLAVKKAIVDALSVRDPSAPVVVGKSGQPEPDPQLRTNEQVPEGEEIDEYMAREVLPYASEAWPDLNKNKLGYEIPIIKLFFKPTLSRPLDEIEEDLRGAAADLITALEQTAS